MRCRSVDGRAICIALVIGDRRKRNPWWSTLILVMGCTTCDVMVRQSVSLACLHINLAVAGLAGVSSLSFCISECMCTVSSVSWAFLTELTKCMIASVLPGVSIASRRGSPSNGVVLVAFVGSLQKASVAWPFKPTL